VGPPAEQKGSRGTGTSACVSKRRDGKVLSVRAAGSTVVFDSARRFIVMVFNLLPIKEKPIQQRAALPRRLADKPGSAIRARVFGCFGGPFGGGGAPGRLSSNSGRAAAKRPGSPPRPQRLGKRPGRYSGGILIVPARVDFVCFSPRVRERRRFRHFSLEGESALRSIATWFSIQRGAPNSWLLFYNL
jgi:hypothetical protein